MVTKIELQDRYSIVVENCPDKLETKLGIEGYSLIFTKKQDVLDHITLLEKALEFWEYD